jgi:hypothetical protein
MLAVSHPLRGVIARTDHRDHNALPSEIQGGLKMLGCIAWQASDRDTRLPFIPTKIVRRLSQVMGKFSVSISSQAKLRSAMASTG